MPLPSLSTTNDNGTSSHLYLSSPQPPPSLNHTSRRRCINWNSMNSTITIDKEEDAERSCRRRRRRRECRRTMIFMAAMVMVISSFDNTGTAILASAFTIRSVTNNRRPIHPIAPSTATMKTIQHSRSLSNERRRIPPCSMLHSTSSEETTVMAERRAKLEKLTVKRLKEVVQTMDLPAGTKMSHLRLKADLVQFLLDASIGYQKTPTDKTNGSDPPPPTNPPPKVSLRTMPSLHTTEIPSPTTTTNETLSLKDQLFRDVIHRYPPLSSLPSLSPNPPDPTNTTDPILLHTHPSTLKSLTGLGDLDVRQMYHPILAKATSSDLDIVFVGTASCVPGITRGVSCTAVRVQRGSDRGKEGGKEGDAGIWVFDAGECTQLQIQRSSGIRAGKINKIFLTHSHGDHSFGLPGLLCFLGQDCDRNAPPLQIYGPEGLRMWLRTSIRFTVSRVVPNYVVHELMDIPMAPEWIPSKRAYGSRFYHEFDHRSGRGGGGGGRSEGQQQDRVWGAQSSGFAGEDRDAFISRAPHLKLDPSPHYGEQPGGRDIYPSYDHPSCVEGAPIWEVLQEGKERVYAAPMSHTIPCVGYVIEEEDRPGRLKSDLVTPIAKRNAAELSKMGMRHPMKILATIKDLPPGGSYTFPDGTIVSQSDVVEPSRRGRKIVICGDTSSPRAIAGLAKDCDVLVHEATNAFLSGIDDVDGKGTKNKTSREAMMHGHCTPVQAGEFAKKVGAKRLVMNHFSSRYKGDQSLDSISVMTRIERIAIEASGLPEDMVAAAWDFMLLPVPRN